MGSLATVACSRPVLHAPLLYRLRLCSWRCTSIRETTAGSLHPKTLLRCPSAGKGIPAGSVLKTPFHQAARQRGLVVSAMAAADQPAAKKLDLSKELALYPESTPQISASSGNAAAWKGDLLAIGIFEDSLSVEAGEGGPFQDAELAALDGQLEGILTELIEKAEFKGKQGSSSFTRLKGNAHYVGVVGLGKKEAAAAVPDWGIFCYQAFGGAVAAAAKQNKATSAAVTVLGGEPLSDTAVEKFTVGALLGGYEAQRFKNKPTPLPLKSVDILCAGGDVAAAIARGEGAAKGVLLSRYLVETPSNICTPTYLATAAAAIVESAPDVLKLEVLEEDACKQMGMGCFLGVTACSEEPAKFIHLTYTPKGEVKKVVGLVGKGVTFDSGGYNLKVGGMIDMMKFDMGGAAAVLGAAQYLSSLQPPGVQVHIITAACENMIDGRGMRPGDILQAANGKTVEVNNTDAEGRLTLADALWYAQEKCGVQAVVDVATLTGACMVALGNQVAGVFTPSEAMAASLKDASKTAGEKIWRMPMEDSYWEQMKSPIADMKNTGGRMGGAITAALFLREFVDTDKVEWAHVDIAGPAWDEKAGGATGFGALTLAEWAAAQGSA
ncbi:Leucine aminopeptidase 2, chloroplastic [Coccomyxa sp. Obi]|nr:Leucine aminopeptidase 2, chloroplastic [Coccomyxa sp. Obi]